MSGSEFEDKCFNALAERTELSFHQSLSIGVVLSCFSPIITAVSLIFCIALLKTEQYKKHSQRFIIILAISDLFVGCFTVPVLTVDFTIYHATRNCSYEKFSLFVGHFNTRLTAYVIFLIGIDRYLNINPQMRAKSKLSRRIESRTGYRIMIIVALAICAVQGCIPIIEFKERRLPDNLSAALDSVIYLTYLIIYLRLYWKIMRFSRNNSVHSSTNETSGYRPRYIKNLVKTVLNLLLTVGFCYLPYVAVKFTTTYIRHEKQQGLSQTWRFVQYLSFQPIIVNSFFNTIIILNRNSVLKRYVLDMFPCCRSPIVSPMIRDSSKTKRSETTQRRRPSTLDPANDYHTGRRESVANQIIEVALMNRRSSKVAFRLPQNDANAHDSNTSSV